MGNRKEAVDKQVSVTLTQLIKLVIGSLRTYRSDQRAGLRLQLLNIIFRTVLIKQFTQSSIVSEVRGEEEMRRRKTEAGRNQTDVGSKRGFPGFKCTNSHILSVSNCNL